MDPIVVKMYSMSECELRVSIQTYRAAKWKILVSWLGFAAAKWVGGLLIFLLSLVVIMGPVFVFDSWLPGEWALGASTPVMLFVVWLLATHPRFNAFLNEWHKLERQWKLELDRTTDALNALIETRINNGYIAN